MSNDKNTFTVPEANGFHELEQDEVKKSRKKRGVWKACPDMMLQTLLQNI